MIHPKIREKLRSKLTASLVGFDTCTDLGKEIIEDLFMLTLWHKNGTEFGPDSLEIVTELENENLSVETKDYIEKLCIQLGGN